MNNLTKLKIAADVLSEFEQFNDAQLIGILNWKSIPPAYRLVYSLISREFRIEAHKLNDTLIVDIRGLGYFQII